MTLLIPKKSLDEQSVYADSRDPTAIIRRDLTGGLQVQNAMIRSPKVLEADATVREVRKLLTDSHVHMALLTHDGVLVAALVPSDFLGAVDGSSSARMLGPIRGRTVAPDALAEETRIEMIEAGRRRLAVVDPVGTLLGLLCLKRSQLGFCSERDVAARASMIA